MKQKNKRRRTGCITCRVRRVKCDEVKPECERCLASNVECRGYEQKRQIQTQRPSSEISGPSKDAFTLPLLRHHANQSSLVALPQNPTPAQRPHARARDVLAYHQYIFRTVHTLCRANHLCFWRDWICEKAWDTEYVFDAVVALGTIHRARLLLSTGSTNDTNRGLDTSIIAEQAYTNALQEFSRLVRDGEKLDIQQIAVALLLASFECFAGNAPAAYRLVGFASSHFLAFCTAEDRRNATFIEAIQQCIGRMARLFRVILPLAAPHTFHPALPPYVFTSEEDFKVVATNDKQVSADGSLLELYSLSASPAELWDLVWHPLQTAGAESSLQQMHQFLERVQTWRLSHSHLLPEQDPEAATPEADLDEIYNFAFPPEEMPASTLAACMIGIIYEFYHARAQWILSFSSQDTAHHKLAYVHCYRALSWTRSAIKILGQTRGSLHGNSHESFDVLQPGLVPILHLIGHMSPRQDWLRWIAEQLEWIGDEGLFSGSALAKSLRVLGIFEMRNNIALPLIGDHLPSPRHRTIAVPVPKPHGCGFTVYYASPAVTPAQAGVQAYYPVGWAHWSNDAHVASNSPDIEFVRHQSTTEKQLMDDWLLGQEPIREWLHQGSSMEFNLDCMLSVHIGSNRLIKFVRDKEKSEG